MSPTRKPFRFSIDRARLSPPAVLALTYSVFIIVGAIILWLPFSHTGSVTLSDAFFTAASAVTVTGLIVVDTGSAYTVFGQVIIAILIQLGGLGLMTFAVLLLSMLGVAIALPQRIVLRDEVGQVSLSELGGLVRIVFGVAIVVQAIGTVILMSVFVPAFGWAAGFWQALFHAISAFNNAGFSLFSDSLSSYVGDPIVNLTISLMFIIGGLGFVVLVDLFRVRSWRRLALHSKLMLVGTAALILLAWIGFALLEWNNPATLGTLDHAGVKLLASWFQAVTPRTAGFNTLDYAEVTDSTAIMTMALMVVGGGPTSTAGGIKVTTLIVLALATIAFLQRREQLHIFGRSLALEEVIKVLALTALSLFLLLVGMFLLSLSYSGPFIDLIFEVTSAFGTVGLSRGATGELDTFGRIIIILMMFVGRLGPLTLGFLLATRASPRIQYPKGKVLLG